MHPVLSSPRAIAWYIWAWSVAGLLMAWGLVARGLAQWPNALWFALPVAVGFGFVATSAYYICRAVPVAQRRLVVGLSTFVLASGVAATVTWAAAIAWNQFCLAWGMAGTGVEMTTVLNAAVWMGSAALFVVSLLVHDIMITMDQMRQSQQRELQSRALARDAELQLLRAQVNPHFLFNSLNSISALTSMDPAAARCMTIALAQYFRQTLSLSSHATIPLAQEVAHCQCFLDIETQRFGPKLQVDVQLDGTAGSALVPPMLLQPLVENAVKHGIANSIRGGTVRIHAAAQGAWLHVTIDNPAEGDPGHPPAADGKPSAPRNNTGLGLGMRATRQRLHGLYGDQARVVHRVERKDDDDRFVVELTLPFQPTITGASDAPAA